MDDVLIDVFFKVGTIGIARKIYTVSLDSHIRKFKFMIIDDLKNNHKIEFSDLEIQNYGIARMDSYNRQIYFLNDHSPVSVLTSVCGSAIANSVTFALRYRSEYPFHLTSKKIRKINREKNRVKFMEYIQSENYEGFKKSLSKGIDPNFIHEGSGESPLMIWCRMKSNIMENFLNTFIEYQTHFDFRDRQGKCAIHYAIMCENKEAIKLLCQKGSSLHEWDDKGIPAFFYSMSNDIQVNFFRFIIEFNNNINIRDSSKNNAIHYVVKKGLANHLGVILTHISTKLSQLEVTQMLSARNISGNTPIHMCILQNQKTCLLMLSKIKICNLVKNASGDSAIDLATKICSSDAIGILKNTTKRTEDFRSKTLTYSQSVQHCLSYANTLRKGKHSTGKLFNSYPPIFRCQRPYKTENEQFELEKNDCIFVYLVLRTKVAYGYKVLSDDRKFGWFPASVIGIFTSKQIEDFQKDYSNLSNLTLHIPELPTKNQTSAQPILLFLNLNIKETSIGLEIGSKKPKFDSFEKSPTTFASPLYVRNVETDSPADISGLRIGDQILYIMSNEITTLSLKMVKSIFKKMLQSKPPSGAQSNIIRQISIMVLREMETSSIFNCEEMYDTISECVTFNNFSPQDTIGTASIDIHPKFLDKEPEKRKPKYQRRQTYHPLYSKPLPSLPPEAQKKPLENLSRNQSCESILSSLSNLPPPPPEMLQD